VNAELSSDPPFDFRRQAAEIFEGIACEAVLGAGRPLEGASADESLHVAVSRMWWAQVGALPVLEDGRLIGCFAEEDLLRVLGERLAAAGSGALSVWDELLAKARVGEAMTPIARLPLAPSGAPLLDALRESTAPDGSQGRYLFLVDESLEGQRVRLASFRDVARLLTDLYDGGPASARIGARAERARHLVQEVLGQPIGTVRRRARLGHEPNAVALGSSLAEAVHAMWVGGRGYVVITLADGGPIGIFTRRDVLRACARRYADLSTLRLSYFMSPRVVTVTETDTLCGLFKGMALASCRHMPLVDDWDRLQAVISMWEGVSLLIGTAPEH
jgi:CBS domain-containing protein